MNMMGEKLWVAGRSAVKISSRGERAAHNIKPPVKSFTTPLSLRIGKLLGEE
jgi:hypothetical protein